MRKKAFQGKQHLSQQTALSVSGRGPSRTFGFEGNGVSRASNPHQPLKGATGSPVYLELRDAGEAGIHEEGPTGGDRIRRGLEGHGRKSALAQTGQQGKGFKPLKGIKALQRGAESCGQPPRALPGKLWHAPGSVASGPGTPFLPRRE